MTRPARYAGDGGSNLLEYLNVGVGTLLPRGHGPWEEAVDHGRQLIPLIRGADPGEVRPSPAASRPAVSPPSPGRSAGQA
ncbi:hypothetical protein MXD62_06120 [Frankia sp. Mgl5]|uniref:hypothetical protein n=1 Tax=Frankia sp. Mgl5 TaxID=2933793 RepID=UPI0020106BDF|nr:hypothetical protein [Frankia sp. Mgl5]MCK9926744.1 hypothetical protein [Frankia sp. Mgl5]